MTAFHQLRGRAFEPDAFFTETLRLIHHSPSKKMMHVTGDRSNHGVLQKPRQNSKLTAPSAMGY